ncbi:cupin domain-containing protein [Luteipulveratus mongoliensis]|uniref:cupin domain-containing protein n=1 Tax=Luteipulveratus mongoliensis TaxID=571913 RepID=UPI00069796CE|nr:cupin domain-containing protein [Luteipulveratus mongoliensis]
MGEVLRLSDHESVEIVSADEACLTVEAVYEPGGSKPPAHYHPQQAEHFTVAEGTLRVERDGETTDFHAGDTLTVEAGQVHRMWNGGDVTTRVRWETTPALDTDEWFRGIDRLHTAAAAKGSGRPDPLTFAAYAVNHRNTFRLVLGGPRQAGDLVVLALGNIGRLLGR